MKNFIEVNDTLTRGGSPTPKDVQDLKKSGVERIISLDKDCGSKIQRSCNLLNMEQVIIPLEAHDKKSFKHLFKYDIKDLFNKNTFVHCYRGIDRTGFLVALQRCLLENWDCRKALKEAKMLRFGTGMSSDVEKYCTKLIQAACSHDHQEDENAAYDIVSNSHDLNREYRDYTLDYYGQQSFAPYADQNIRSYPYGIVNKYFEEQYPSREEYALKDINIRHKDNQIPMVGIYDVNTQGINGAGPSMIGGGFV